MADKITCICGHQVEPDNATETKAGMNCNFCMQQDYYRKKIRLWMAILWLPLLGNWFLLPGSIIIWIWEGWDLAWRAFLTALVGVFSFGLLYNHISDKVRAKARAKYPVKILGLTFKERMEAMRLEREGKI